MRVPGLALLLMIAACSSQSGAQPSPGTTTSSSSKPQYAFTCSVPVLVDGKTGFVTFPAGSLSTSSETLPTPAPLTNDFSYDRVVDRWLGVSREAVAPDGLHYAYADYDPPGPNDGKAVIGSAGRVHVVDALTGADRVIYSGAPAFAVVDFSASGIYLARFGASIGGSGRRGLYLVGPDGGTPSLVPGSDVPLTRGGWRVLNADSAWGTRFSDVEDLWGGNELVRLDMKTGEIVQWLTVPTDHGLTILGFDAGHPLVSSSLSLVDAQHPSQTSVMLMTAPEQSTQLYATDTLGPSELGVADTHGIWMGGPGSVWLYRPASGLQQIHIVDDPNAVVQVGGACA